LINLLQFYVLLCSEEMSLADSELADDVIVDDEEDDTDALIVHSKHTEHNHDTAAHQGYG